MSLEIVLGPMFSGKSSYALSYIRRQRAIDRSVIAIKPASDSRYSENEEIVTHNQDRIPCIKWNTKIDLTPTQLMIESTCLVVEEAQFFTGLVTFCEYMTAIGIDIVLVGLDGDAHRHPFHEILDCIPLANKVTKLNAACSVCKDGTDAPFTRWKPNSNHSGERIDIGGAEKYEAVCRKHYR